MPEITKESQELLEKDIRQQITNLGFALYKLPQAVQAYHAITHIHKVLVEYFNNTRLLADKPKGE